MQQLVAQSVGFFVSIFIFECHFLLVLTDMFAFILLLWQMFWMCCFILYIFSLFVCSGSYKQSNYAQICEYNDNFKDLSFYLCYVVMYTHL